MPRPSTCSTPSTTFLTSQKLKPEKSCWKKRRWFINTLLNNIKSILIARIHAKGLQLQVITDATLPELRGDATRLQQALINYVGNAIKFTERGTITLRTLKQQESTDSVLLRFDVQDTGVGIAPRR